MPIGVNPRPLYWASDLDDGTHKNIDQVMADQADVVEVRHTLRQVLNDKGIDVPPRPALAERVAGGEWSKGRTGGV